MLENQMKQKYEGLDFEIVKETIARHCSFSLSKQQVMDSEPQFEYLYTERMLARGRQALKLHQAYGTPSFGGISDVYGVLKDVSKGKVISIEELLSLANLMSAYQNMHSYLRKSEIKAEFIEELIHALTNHDALRKEIESKLTHTYEIKDDASKELYSIRKSIHSTESEVSKKTTELMAKYSDHLMENITAMRNNRICLLVKIADKYKVKGFIHDESASGQAVYVEPEALLVLNNRLQTLKAREKNEEERILRALCENIMPHVDALSANLDTLTLLDTLFAKAKWAEHMGAIYADLDEQGEWLYFKDARHPLIDEEKVVSNTYEIKAPNRHLLISGSNTGGKTVTLKTIGLFTLLSMSGFPIPCEQASVPMFDNLFVDVGDFQSILESLSTFSAHLSKLSKILDSATSKSLVLLDELGSGTDPNEGECLAIAILDYLKRHKIMSVATTHYSKVKEYAKSQDEILLSSVGFNLETMAPTYKYLSGFGGNSNALEIAKRYHIKDEIIEYAYKLRDESYSNHERLLEKIEADRLRLIDEQEQLSIDQEALKKLEAKLSAQIDKATLSNEAKEKEAYAQAEAIMEDARIKAKAIIDELKQMQHVKEHEIIEKVSQLKIEKEEVEVEPEEVFKLHDYVAIKGLQYHGEIISIKGNKATVLCNGMRMNVKVNELRKSLRPKVKTQTSVSSKSSVARPKLECNVIGMHVDEALQVVAKYLDNAMYHKIYTVTLIHGSGTGALRSAIHEFLKRQKYVKEFRLGGEYEGGLGATVVTLRGGTRG